MIKSNYLYKAGSCVSVNSRICSIVFLLILTACVSLNSNEVSLYSGDKWVILPISNSSGIAAAADVTESIIESNLRARGVESLQRFSDKPRAFSVSLNRNLDSRVDNKLLKQANNAGARYAITGVVEQWGRSKLNGRDSRVQLALSVYDVSTGKLLWKDEQSAAGKASSSVAKAANKSIAKLINNMNIVVGSHPETVAANHALAVQSTSNALRVGDQNSIVTPSLGFRRVSMDNNGFAEAVKRDIVGESIALYYGANPPIDELSQFDRLVLEPDNVNDSELKGLTEHGAVAYAYLSVGEVGATRSYASSVKDEWILGKNDVWNSKVLDLSNPGWTEFLMRRIDSLVNSGYSGLFLDTMDSYHIYATSPEQKKTQELALGSFIKKVTQRHAGIRLIANRGFEVLEYTGPYLEAIAAESLFASWDNSAQRYVDVPEADRQWLLEKLNTAKKQFDLDVVAIEYLPPERREEARQVATSVVNLGFVPWVSTPSLDYIGVGALEVVPRKVMLLFDSRINGQQFASQVHELVAPLLEYYGYVPKYIDVANQELPAGELKGQYAGIVSWSYTPYDVPSLSTWIKQQFKSNIPIAMFGTPIIPIDRWLSERMGVRTNTPVHADSIKTVFKSALIGYESSIPARTSNVGLNVLNNSSDNEVQFTVEDNKGVKADLVITGKWGGIAASPATVVVGFDEVSKWVVNPFTFLEKSLRLQKLPMPDVTTENGNRLWLSHIDGDALPSWAEVSERKLGAEMIHELILQRYKMPHSISIVEGEMTSISAVEDRRERMFDVARRIFAMPSVEIATHTFSHPFNWQLVGKWPRSGKYNIDVGDYRYSPEREIGGSARFINKNLAPANKKTELMLWSGNALPDEAALAAAYSSGLINLNGGYTVISESTPSVSLISPMARTVGPYVQAYAPIMNENIYTNDWLGPFDGFRRVIETFKMTDKPRRFKPLSIYYHFYAGTKKASLRSLEEIYEWSTKQDILPVHASYYARKVPEFRKAGVARYLDGTWKISALGSIRSIRILDENSWPDLSNSRGLVGSRKLHDGIYLHTDGSDSVLLKTANKAPKGVHIVSANGHVDTWRPSDRGVELRITGQVPIKLELSSSARACAIRSSTGSVRGTRTAEGTTLFTFSSKDTGNAVLNCQA